MDRPVKIIAIDDEETMLKILKRSLEPEGYVVETFCNAPSALQSIRDSGHVDIVITDLMMPDMDGFEVIEDVHSINKDIAVIVITAYSSVESAVKAVKAGAYDFIPKPFDPEHMLLIVKRALETRTLRLENIGLKKKLQNLPFYGDMIGASASMRLVFGMIEKVRNTDGTVLITGESGTGKELAARAIHYGSSRADKPFIPINCGALPDDLLESELFGYEKGAFTGAVSRKTGLFEAAQGGTVFLDEVSSISPMMQVKLLRFIQERNFMRLGGSDIIDVDVRIVAATNEDLKELVEEGSFRKDLYYRLNVIPIEMPPLRQRSDDIPLLIRHFISIFSNKAGKTISGITDDAQKALINYRWDGNVRELENIIERAITITDNDIIDCKDLPAEALSNFADVSKQPLYPPSLKLSDVERMHIESVLKSVDYNKSKTAKILGIDYTTLLRKLKTMNLDV
jgi:DNA-binding NtrC family response regulator